MAVLGVFALLLTIIVPSAVIALIIATALSKEKGTKVSRYTLGVKTVYTYIIVIATLFMIISGTIVAVSSLLDYFLPESELESVEHNCTDYYSTSYCSATTKEIRVKNERNAGITEFTSSLALVLIATPLFISHSKDAKKLREVKVEIKEKEDKKTKTTPKGKKESTTKQETK